MDIKQEVQHARRLIAELLSLLAAQSAQIEELKVDAEAMALVKKLRLNVLATENDKREQDWFVCIGANRKHEAAHTDLNQAILECVAALDVAKQGAKP